MRLLIATTVMACLLLAGIVLAEGAYLGYTSHRTATDCHRVNLFRL